MRSCSKKNLQTGGRELMAESMFYLMHKNDRVTVVVIDEISGAITKVAPNARQELLPLGGCMGADTLRKWWQQRAVPVTQGALASVLQAADIPTTQNLMVRCLGLSLSDHYWICPMNRDYTWEEINLYTNDFHDEIGEAIFHKTLHADSFSGDAIRSPAASLQGDLQKRWIATRDGRYLIKGNHGPNSQQSINEVFASLLHKQQGFQNYTEYEVYPLKTEVGGKLGCICKSFTSEKLEFIPAIDVVNSKKKDNAMSQYEHFIKVCADNGLDQENVRSFLEYQIATDFLLTNTDRHLNNFGVLRDSDSLKFVSMAPIFDSGNAMFWDCPMLPLRDSLEHIAVNSFRQKESDLLKLVQHMDCVDLSRLPTDEQFGQLYGLDPQINIEAILKGYHRKIELLSQWMK